MMTLDASPAFILSKSPAPVSFRNTIAFSSHRQIRRHMYVADRSNELSLSLQPRPFGEKG